MTLIIVMIAAVITMIAWKRNTALPAMRMGILCFMYCLSALGCIADLAWKWVKNGQLQVDFNVGAIIHDGYTGIGIVAVGLIIWLAIILLINKIKND